jgi:hypothetical protein
MVYSLAFLVTFSLANDIRTDFAATPDQFEQIASEYVTLRSFNCTRVIPNMSVCAVSGILPSPFSLGICIVRIGILAQIYINLSKIFPGQCVFERIQGMHFTEYLTRRDHSRIWHGRIDLDCC